MASQTESKISIIIPVLNEAPSLKTLYSQIRDVMTEMGNPYEVIFVDDGSTDDSFEVMKEIYLLSKKENDSLTSAELKPQALMRTVNLSSCSGQSYSQLLKRNNNAQITVIQFRRNMGKAAALAAVFANATGDIIITMDADLQDDPAEIPNFVAKIHEGYDVVSGWKFHRKDSLSKVALSKIFNQVTCLATRLKLHDINCGFKAYRLEVIRDIQVYGELHRYLPILAHQKGYRIAEIKVQHHPRQFGRSKYSIGRIPKGFYDLLTVLFLTKYINRPMHVFGTFGIGCIISGTFINLYLAILWVLQGGIGFRPLLMLGILLMILGAQFFSVGLLGEMFINRFEAFQQKYPIKTILK